MTGKMRLWRTAWRRPSCNVFDRQRAFLEEFFEQRVVAFRHHLDQRFVRAFAASAISAGNIAFLALAVAVERVGVRLHADQVHHALEIALGADGQVDRHGGAAEDRLHAFKRPLEAGALAVELVDDDGARQAEIVRRSSRPFRSALRRPPRHPPPPAPHRRPPSKACASLIKILKPGVSSRLIFFLFHSAAATAVEIVILRWISSSSKSVMSVALVDARQAAGNARGEQQARH